MSFEEKYCGDSEKAKEENKDKKIISNDAFALGDIIQTLINKIEHARLSLNGRR